MNTIDNLSTGEAHSCDWLSGFRMCNVSPSAALPSRVSVVSMPLPEGADAAMVGRCHLEGAATQRVDLGWYPGGTRSARRQLWYSLHDSPVGREVALSSKAAGGPKPSRENWAVELVETARDFETTLPSLSHVLELRFGGKAVQVFPGLRWRGELHPWQWSTIEPLWAGPVAKAFLAGGVIEVVPTTIEEIFPPNGARSIRKSEWLHRQNWLRGELYVVCFANGTVEITARHVNNQLFDQGRDQHEVQTAIYFRSEGLPDLDEPWTGERTRFDLGRWSLDLTASTGLVSANNPGSLKAEDGLLEWKPYSGVEIGGDKFDFCHNGERFVTAEEQLWPRGVARSVRFGISLGAEPAAVARLLPPAWWYGHCGDGWPGGYLPAKDASEEYMNRSLAYTLERKGGRCEGRFDDSVTGWEREGESSYAEFLHAYRNQSADSYQIAIRDSYHLADIAFDHASGTVRMHNYPFDGSFSLPMLRNLGVFFGFLETGDPYLLNVARIIAERFYQIHIMNWPRYSIGRDAIAVRGLIFLAQYLGEDLYMKKAREILHHLAFVQRPDGSFSDQGGGVGIHAAGYLCSKPWMANLANEAVMDYLETVGGDLELEEETVRYGAYLVQHGPDVLGDACWPYQTHYAGGTFDPVREFFKAGNGKLPDTKPQVMGHKARALIFLTKQTRDPRYWNAWRAFVERHWIDKEIDRSIHPAARLLQSIPYAAAHSWNARWNSNGTLSIAPLLTERFPELAGSIQTPQGEVALRARWDREAGEIAVSADQIASNSFPGLNDIQIRKDWLLI